MSSVTVFTTDTNYVVGSLFKQFTKLFAITVELDVRVEWQASYIRVNYAYDLRFFAIDLSNHFDAYSTLRAAAPH